MKVKHKNIVILGAGAAGMACAMELWKNKESFTLVEKDKQVGGLAKTYRFGKFLTDNGPHRFFSKNKFLYQFIEDLLKEKWIKVNRSTKFFIRGKNFTYPVKIGNILKNIDLLMAIQMLVDYLVARVIYLNKPINNFEDYAVKSFGRTLAKFNVLDYTEKIWGIPCSQLSPDWGEQRIQGLSFSALIKSFFKKGGVKSLVDQFYFPEKGSGQIYEAVLAKIAPENQILLNTSVKKIRQRNGVITEIALSKGKKIIKPDFVISSLPISLFCKLLTPSAPRKVTSAAGNLRFRSQVFIFLTIKRKHIGPDQWVYFPDQEIPFGRFSEMKNFSSVMAPKNQTSLLVEYFCWKGDRVWNMTKDQITKLTVSWLEKLKILDQDEVIDSYQIKQEYVYPVYDLNYQRNLGIVKKYLDTVTNLIYIGRPGRFKYTNQDHSLEMGFLAAQKIIAGRNIDLDDIGSEKEYFEKGYVR